MRADEPHAWRAMLFDLDGTLADTAPDLIATFGDPSDGREGSIPLS